MFIRADHIFSYWILVWYVAYMAKLTTYNPKIAFFLGIAENISVIIGLLLLGAKTSSIIQFGLINTIIKGIPIYTMYNTTSTVKDIYAFIILYAIYIAWMYANKCTLLEYYKKVFQSILQDRKDTPFMWLIENIRRTLHI